ncbi:MAG: hypothetical protein FWH29_02570 [Methanobrevibacter sp.]|nr:hypothetical protein [Methanobrevibacter sp.]
MEHFDKVAKAFEIFVKGIIIKTNLKIVEPFKCGKKRCKNVNIPLTNDLTNIYSKIRVNELDIMELSNIYPRINSHY